MKKALVAIGLGLSLIFGGVVLAECPPDTYPCIIDGQPACCPKKTGGVRGDIGDYIILADYDPYCESLCLEIRDNCIQACIYKYDVGYTEYNICTTECEDKYLNCRIECSKAGN